MYKIDIINYWTDNTDPSPIIRTTLIGKDARHLIRHQIHCLKETINEFYEIWRSKNAPNICRTYQKPIPSQSVFYNSKPVFVHCDYKISYNLCTFCFNFANALNAHHNTLVENHHCKTTACIDYKDEMGAECGYNCVRILSRYF